MSSGRIHCCYIITGTEFKLSSFGLLLSALGLEEKMFYVIKMKECRKNCLSFSPCLEPQTPSSSGTLDFLSTYLRIDSLNRDLL